MELQLQLGLAQTNNLCKGFHFDLNNHVYESKELIRFDVLNHGCKRGFDEAFCDDKEHMRKTLHLLWNDQPNDEDDRKSSEEKFDSLIDQNDEEDKGVVGWPPIKSWRKKLHNHRLLRLDCYNSNIRNGNGNGNGNGGSNTPYVKVNMEGVAIGRKINLNLHQSYETLKAALFGMFGKYQEQVKGATEDGTEYKLTYQDREGDWLLVGDVSWKAFTQSVLRLKIERTET